MASTVVHIVDRIVPLEGSTLFEERSRVVILKVEATMILQNGSVLYASREKDVQDTSAKDATETKLVFLIYLQLPTKYERQCNNADICRDAVDSTTQPESTQIDAGATNRTAPHLWYRVTLQDSGSDTSYTIACDYSHDYHIAVAEHPVSYGEKADKEEAKREFARADDNLVNDLKYPEHLFPISGF